MNSLISQTLILASARALKRAIGSLRSRTGRQLWLSITNDERRDVLRLIVGRKQCIEQMRVLKGQQLGFDFEEVVEFGELF